MTYSAISVVGTWKKSSRKRNNMKHRFNSANLDLLANYFYLSGYTVGKVKDVVPSNFSPDDPFQGQTVGGLSINRVFRYGQFSEVIILTSGVAYVKVVNQNGTNTFRGAYPAEIETAKKVIEELIKLQTEL